MKVKRYSANLPVINFEFPSGVFAWNPSNYLIIKYNNTKKKNFAINGLTSKSVIKYIKENNLYLQQDE